MIITAKQGAVTQWRGEVIQYPAFEGNNGLHHNFRSNPREALNTAKNRGQRLADTIEHAATSVGGDRLVEC